MIQNLQCLLSPVKIWSFCSKMRRVVLSLLLRKPTQQLHHQRTYSAAAMPLLQPWPRVFYPFSSSSSSSNLLMHNNRSNMLRCDELCLKQSRARYVSSSDASSSSSLLVLKKDSDVVRFSIGKLPSNGNVSPTRYKRVKMSRKAKLNELRLYRLKAKKKLRSPNPEVRIRYKLEKAKRKEAWLIEKLRKYEILKAPSETHDPEILTEEERFYLKRTGDKKKNYVPVGRRGVFGGVVLNMHLHWKRHETVKVICKACKLGQVDAYAEELARLSKGIVIDIKPNNTILFYRGRNYVQPEDMSPPDTLSKNKALERYKYEQSLEHTSQFIEKLEEELDEYLKHIALYKKGDKGRMQDSMVNT